MMTNSPKEGTCLPRNVKTSQAMDEVCSVSKSPGEFFIRQRIMINKLAVVQPK